MIFDQIFDSSMLIVQTIGLITHLEHRKSYKSMHLRSITRFLSPDTSYSGVGGHSCGSHVNTIDPMYIS